MATALLSFETNFVDQRLQRSIWFLSGLMTVHADARDTGGQMALIEVLGTPGNEPPLHCHENEDELFFVLEGRLRVTRGNEEIILEPGQSAFLPRRVAHTFKIASSHARWLVTISPAGFEEYFRSLGKPAERLAPESNPAPPDLKRMLEEGRKFGITFLV